MWTSSFVLGSFQTTYVPSIKFQCFCAPGCHDTNQFCELGNVASLSCQKRTYNMSRNLNCNLMIQAKLYKVRFCIIKGFLRHYWFGWLIFQGKFQHSLQLQQAKITMSKTTLFPILLWIVESTILRFHILCNSQIQCRQNEMFYDNWC